MICKNCLLEFDDSFDYCPHCGQKKDTKRLNWASLSDNLAKGWFGSDRGVFFTIKALFTRPGKMMKEYIEGKRIQYFGPFQMLFLIATLYYFLKFLFVMNEASILEGNEQIVVDHEIIKISPLFRKILNFINDNLTLLWLLSIPFLTSVFRLLIGRTYRKKYNFVESSFIITYCISQLLIFEIVGLLLDIIFGASLDLSNWLLFSYLFLFAWDLKQIFEGSFSHNFFKGIGIFALALLLIFLALTTIVSILIAFFGSSVNLNIN